MTEPVVAQLQAIRAQALAVVAMVDAALSMMAPEAVEPQPTAGPGECSHPPDDRVPAGVMGRPHQFACTACHQVIDPDAEAADG